MLESAAQDRAHILAGDPAASPHVVMALVGDFNLQATMIQEVLDDSGTKYRHLRWETISDRQSGKDGPKQRDWVVTDCKTCHLNTDMVVSDDGMHAAVIVDLVRGAPPTAMAASTVAPLPLVSLSERVQRSMVEDRQRKEREDREAEVWQSVAVQLPEEGEAKRHRRSDVEAGCVFFARRRRRRHRRRPCVFVLAMHCGGAM
jgi:hypothetical protein